MLDGVVATAPVRVSSSNRSPQLKQLAKVGEAVGESKRTIVPTKHSEVGRVENSVVVCRWACLHNKKLGLATNPFYANGMFECSMYKTNKKKYNSYLDMHKKKYTITKESS